MVIMSVVLRNITLRLYTHGTGDPGITVLKQWDRHPATVATIPFPDVSVHTGLPMMTLKPFELGDHHLAGRDQRKALSVGKGGRLEGLGEARIGSGFLGRIVRSSDNKALNHFPGVV